MNILLTGGTGYIGSHTSVVLSHAGHNVTLFDNFSNSNPFVIEQLQKILGKALPCIKADVRDADKVADILQKHKIDAVVHFAGLKAVDQSVNDPILYYSNNVLGTICLLQAMQKVKVKTLVFSSSATVYGQPQYLPYDESHPTKPINPYGRSKQQIEEILNDLACSDSEWKIVSLRYFNPVGAHESGLIGEDPTGKPSNLMPYVARVVSGEFPHLNIFGNDYKTKDGTGERDYIHVLDLAEGHLAALEFIVSTTGFKIFNLGTGRSISVLELVDAFEKASQTVIKKVITERRSGDLPIYYADVSLAKKVLGWEAKRTLNDICKSVHNFISNLQGR